MLTVAGIFVLIVVSRQKPFNNGCVSKRLRHSPMLRVLQENDVYGIVVGVRPLHSPNQNKVKRREMSKGACRKHVTFISKHKENELESIGSVKI